MRIFSHSAFRKPILFLSSGTYLGYIPIASGTFGTLWGVPLFYWLSKQRLGEQLLILVGFVFFSIFLAGQAEKLLGKKDPSQVVIDEIVGYLTAMSGLSFSWTYSLLGFLIFRAMDILKPFPIRKIDKQLPGGWGIVLDDVLAGIYCQILLRILIYLHII